MAEGFADRARRPNGQAWGEALGSLTASGPGAVGLPTGSDGVVDAVMQNPAGWRSSAAVVDQTGNRVKDLRHDQIGGHLIGTLHEA